MSVPTAEIQTLTPGTEVVMFTLDATVCGGSVFHCSPMTNPLGTAFIWQGVTYTPYPIQAEGFDMSSKGVMPRPTIRVANLDGLIGSQIRDYGDLVGAKVTRKRTLLKFLDGPNFPGGVSTTADPTACFPDDIFYIEQKTAETPELIEWALVASGDLQGMQLPRRIIQKRNCTWNDAAICPYSVGGACGKTLPDCKGKWGAHAVLPFAGFPGAAML